MTSLNEIMNEKVVIDKMEKTKAISQSKVL